LKEPEGPEAGLGVGVGRAISHPELVTEHLSVLRTEGDGVTDGEPADGTDEEVTAVLHADSPARLASDGETRRGEDDGAVQFQRVVASDGLTVR